VAEGDTIHRLARRLGAELAASIDTAEAPAPDSPLRRQPQRLERLAGSRIEEARAHGKHLLVRFDAGLVLHSHLGMSGRWELATPRAGWRRPARAARLLLAAGAAEAAQFGGTTLALRTESELRADRRLAALGPDVLAAGLTPEAAAASVRRRGADATLGEALLDQTRIAGIGNIFKSESCFAAGIDPWRRLADLGDDELTGVLAAARELMGAAVETGRQPRRIYRRAGACPSCGGRIRSRGQGDANRTTYWCPSCQR